MVKPDYSGNEEKYVAKAVREGETGAKSKYIPEFQEKMAKYLGKNYVIGANSGYSALLIACRVLKEKHYLKTITMPVFTMIASANAAKHAGLDIEFVDVNKRGLMEGSHNVVMTVDIYGNRCEATGDLVIEDAAEYFGPFEHKGLITCFSMNINKVLSTGTGGFCATDDVELAKEMDLYAHHYYDGDSYYHDKDGYHVGMNGMQAALGLAQLERADEILESRAKVGQRYVAELPKAWECETYWYQPYLCDSVEEQVELKAHLETKGIAHRDFFPQITDNTPYSNSEIYKNAQDLFLKGLLLPVYSNMTDEEQSYVINTIKELD